MIGVLLRVFRVSWLFSLQMSQRSWVSLITSPGWLSRLWDAPAVLQTPKLVGPRFNGALQERCPDEILGSSANAGPRLHCTVCKHAGRELAQPPPGSFQIPRNFYSQHGRPLDCKSFFSTENYFTELWHSSDTTEARPLSLSPTGKSLPSNIKMKMSWELT